MNLPAALPPPPPRRRIPAAPAGAVKIAVGAQVFSIACAESERESLAEAAKEVTRRIASIRKDKRVADGERAAIMAALELAFESARRGMLNPSDGEMTASEIRATIQVLRKRAEEALSDSSL